MQPLSPELWISDAPLRFAGVEMGARMTVVRLSGDRLLLHSPTPATDALVRKVDELGTVTYLVAPNKLHHLYAGDWQQAYPDASLYVAPGLDSKRPDLMPAGVLGDEPEPGWQDELDQVLLGGFPFSNEVIFFHRASATLVVADLAFNVGPSSPLLTRLAFRLGGTYGRLSPTLLERVLVRDRAAFRRSLERVLEWPFERVVVAHGEVSEAGGRDELRRGFSWILANGRAD